MRNIAALIALLAAPAAAEPIKDQPTPQEVAEMQRQIADPATGAALSRMTGVLAKALMNLPVGEMEAAIEGRAPTPADKKRTVQDSLGGPAEAARVERELAASGAQMQVMQKALAAALPGMIAAAGEVEKAIGEAEASLPKDPPLAR